MGVALPVSRLVQLLVLALPLVYLGGRALAHALTTDRALRTVLPFGLGGTVWLLSVHAVGLATRSFLSGLVIGTLLSAALGVAAEVARRRRPPAPATGDAPSRWLWITLVFATALMAPVALDWAFHDELLFTGHMSVASEIQNDIYPPRHLSFPVLPLRYHYGFDLLSATVGVLARARVDRAIDEATLTLWAYSWALLWVLGERLVGRRLAWLTPLLVMFGTGMPIRCTRPVPSTGVGIVLSVCEVGGKSVNSPIVSYFFQHPWSLGIPLALVAILIFTERRPPFPLARYAALGLVLTLLSLGEIVLFATVLPCLVAAAAFDDGRIRILPVLRMLGVVVVSLLLARALGGFFTTAPGLPHLEFSFHWGMTETWADTRTWNLKTFGMLLPLGVVGIVALPRQRVFFALLFLGSLGVVNLVRYEQSWDIAKFATVAGIALSVLASGTISRIVPRSPRAALTSVRHGLAIALMLPTVTLGFLYPFVFLGDVPGIPSGYKQGDPLSADDARAVSFLRSRMHAGELVFRDPKASRAYAQWGGLPQAYTDLAVRRFGFPGSWIAARERVFKDLPDDLAPYAGEGLRWLVLDPSDKRLLDVTAGWMARGEAREAARFGELRVIEIVAGRPQPPTL